MATTTPTGVPRAFVTAGNAERYVMEADALRRRQLCAAFLHGTARGWRYRRRLWIPALAGVVVVAVIVAAIGVTNAFVRQTEINQDERRRNSLQRTAQAGRPAGAGAGLSDPVQLAEQFDVAGHRGPECRWGISALPR